MSTLAWLWPLRFKWESSHDSHLCHTILNYASWPKNNGPENLIRTDKLTIKRLCEWHLEILLRNNTPQCFYWETRQSKTSVYSRIEWQPVCVHGIWTRLVMRQIHEARVNLVNLQVSSIAFISHERKQVVNQYLYLHFPTKSM